MARFLVDQEIDEILNGSGNEYSDDEDQQNIQVPGQGINVPQSESSSSSDEELPLSDLRWRKKKFQSKAIPRASDPKVRAVLTPTQYFERYFTPELMEQFALTTNQYYMTQTGNQMKPVCTSGEIKKFFGIHGLMGCFSYPRIKLFWNQRYNFDSIANSMPRDRFFLLRVNLHVLNVHAVNKEVEQAKNRLWRVQPVIDAVRNRCLQLPRDANHYSIDEQMVPFGGRCAGLKVVVKNKPRPEELKNYVVTSSEGTVLDFEIYQGNTTNLPDLEKFGMGPAVILRLASTLPDLLAFRLNISEFLLVGSPRSAGANQEQEFAEMPSTSKYRPKPLPPIDTQRDGYNHWPVMDTLKEPRVCRALKCKSRSRCRCSKCDVYLCLTKDRNCFYEFHNQH